MKLANLCAVLVVAATALPAQSATLFFDVGSSGVQTAGAYNNIYPLSPAGSGFAAVNGAVDSTGAATGVSVSTSGFNPTANGSGASSPSGDAAMFASSATQDSLFGHTSPFSGANPLPAATITIDGLIPNDEYNFTFFGSRMFVSDNRETRFDLAGANSAFGELNVAANQTDVVSVLGIQPDASGQVTLTVSPGDDNNNGSGFYYLGAFKVEGNFVPEPGAAMLLLAGLFSAAARRR